MSFKDYIPEEVLESGDADKFLNVMDGVQELKTEIISESLRVNNNAVNLNRKWITKRLIDCGLSIVPVELPLAILLQVLLNVDTIFRTRGSKIGVELFCSIFSLGRVTVDDSKFYADPTTLLLDSKVQGYIVDDSTDIKYGLVDDNANINPAVSIKIAIESKYFNGSFATEAALIKNFISTNLPDFLGFSPNKTITYTYTSRDSLYYHSLLNPYFHE